MFKKIKKLFKKNDPKNEEDVIALISYQALRNGDMKIDIQLEDLNDETIQIFSKVFARVTTLALASETIGLTKGLFEEAGEEKLVKLMVWASEECNNISNEYEITEQESYILPSEMFNEK